MTHEELKTLQVGDVVRHVSQAGSFTVTGTYGDRATAVRTVDVTNPSEWLLFRKLDEPVPVDRPGMFMSKTAVIAEARALAERSSLGTISVPREFWYLAQLLESLAQLIKE